MTLRVCLLKLRTMKQGRAWDRRSKRKGLRGGEAVEGVWATVSSLESLRKGGLGDRFRESALDELLLLAAPFVASLVGTLTV